MDFTRYTHSGDGDFIVTEDMKQDFAKDGFVFVKSLLSDKEVNHVEKALHTGDFQSHSYGCSDGKGLDAHIILWNHPGVDVTGMVARCEKVAGSCEQFLGGEVYHYNTKLMKKPPMIGGSHIWHQDYGYWYLTGCLYPRLMTVFIAIDKCTKDNGCLQVLRGSNQCGRLDHKLDVGQMTVDAPRLEAIRKNSPLEFIEMEPGDALFFDCTLLHCSSSNFSANRRWALLCAYNRADNDPIPDVYNIHPNYTKLEKVPNSAILDCTDFTTMDGKAFLDPVKKVVLPGHHNFTEEELKQQAE